MIEKIIIISLSAFLLTGCAVSTKEPKELSELSTENALFLDVRTKEEFNTGYIPNAINIPNETIGGENIPELPDKNQKIYVYCKSGIRSKEAVDKLIKLGYTDVIDFGGIDNWTGELISSSFTTGEFYKDNICIDIKNDNTYSISVNDEEKDKGTWEHNKGLTLISDVGNKYYFSVAKRIITFNKDYSDNFPWAEFIEGEKFAMNAYYEGNTVYMMTGNDFDFKTINPEFSSISILSPTIKDNIEEQLEKDNSWIILRTTGRITNFHIEGTALTIITSDGEDEAEVEAIKTNGENEIFTVKYDCNCG